MPLLWIVVLILLILAVAGGVAVNSFVWLLLVIALVMRRSILVAAPAALGVIALAGVLDMMANAFYVLAAYAGYLSIAAVLTSLYPASTVILAWIVLKERLQAVQYTGLICALVGVMLIAL